MTAAVFEGGGPIPKTATGTIQAAGGTLLGFYVNSTTAGTIVLRDGGSGGTVMGGTITPAIGYHRFPASFNNNLYATIGGTLDVTFFVVAG